MGLKGSLEPPAGMRVFHSPKTDMAPHTAPFLQDSRIDRALIIRCKKKAEGFGIRVEGVLGRLLD